MLKFRLIGKSRPPWLTALAMLVLLGQAGGVQAKKHAPSLKQKRANQAWSAEFQEGLDLANKKCGTKMKAAIDWSSFQQSAASRTALNGRWSVAEYCAPVVNVVRWECERDAFGKAAAKNVKHLVCRFALQGKRAVAWEKGTLTFGADLGAANADEMVKAFYLDKLGLKEARSIAYEEAEFAKEVEQAQRRCRASGSNKDWVLRAAIDWESFRRANFVEQNYSVHGYCSSVLSGMERVCGDADGQAAVQSSISALLCRHDPKKKTQSLRLKNGELVWTFSWDAPNGTDFSQRWLEENL